MERKLYFADAFPHHETCTCKSCIAENERQNHNLELHENLSEKNKKAISDSFKAKQDRLLVSVKISYANGGNFLL